MSPCYREGTAATLCVYDSRGRRLGTVYPGRMPEAGQGTLSDQLTALIEEVLAKWDGLLPRLAYVTEAACKTVFTERLKQSGISWEIEGGQTIVDLRVIHLSRVWAEVRQKYLSSKILPDTRTQPQLHHNITPNAA